MTDPTQNALEPEAMTETKGSSRTFLCVVDQSDEMEKALRFACRRAKSTDGRVALLSVIEPSDFQHWMFVGDLMREEARLEAEEMIRVLSGVVQRRHGGKMPVVHIREGRMKDALMDVIKEEDISVLVLAASSDGKEGPGPLVSAMLKSAGQFPIPVTIIPGAMSDEEIDAVS